MNTVQERIALICVHPCSSVAKLLPITVMPDDLTFLMGKFAAVLPGDRRYARNHMWAQPAGEGRWRFGFTSYAVRLMQDVYFLEWHLEAGDVVHLLQEIGHIETSKAESDLFSPLKGTLVRFNP